VDSTAHKELVTEAERLEIKSKAPLVLAELLFDQNIHTQVWQFQNNKESSFHSEDYSTFEKTNYVFVFLSSFMCSSWSFVLVEDCII
jgi:hypothetical protein